MDSKLDFLKNLKQTLFENKTSGWDQEYSLFNTIAEEIEWKNKTSSQKHEHRKAAFSLSRKWAKDSFSNETKRTNPNDEYPEALIEIYELTIRLLEKIATIEPTININRLKALLVVEQYFYDEKIIPIRHVPLEMFREVAKESFNSDIASELVKYILVYERLWELWPNNPWLKRNRT